MIDVARQNLSPTGHHSSCPRAYLDIIRWMALAGFLVGLVLLYAWNQAEILRIQYEMEELKSDNSRLESSNVNLRAEYKLLTSPQQIQQKALELGLISANGSQVRIIQAPVRGRSGSSLLAAAGKLRGTSAE